MKTVNIQLKIRGEKIEESNKKPQEKEEFTSEKPNLARKEKIL